MRLNHQTTAIVVIIAALGAGCTQTITVPKIAETLGAAQGSAIGVPQYNGFGKLTQLPKAKTSDSAVINISTELPSLQPNITVVRLPGSGLDNTQFQNLTDAIKFPVGLLGNKPNNLAYGLTWSDGNGFSWSYASQEEKIHFTRLENEALPGSGPISNEDGIINLANNFLASHGIGELTYRNLTIDPEWKKATSTNESVPVTFERIVDERNIIDAIGQPEFGGRLLINAITGTIVSGWIILPMQPERTDYPTISAAEMRQSLESGGMNGTPQGTVDIKETFFAFVRHPKSNQYEQDILSPVLVGVGTQTIESTNRPYRIVVPLIKQ